MKDVIEKFDKVKKYRYLPILVLLSLYTVGNYIYYDEQRILGGTIIVIALVIFFILSSRYRCPACSKGLDPRVSDLKHCPNCGIELNKEHYRKQY